jgi:hypothetical protein
MSYPDQSNLDKLAEEYAKNKVAADALTARNAEIAAELEACATFKDGSNTAHLEAGGYKIKVERRYNVKWMADKLEEARRLLTDDLFFKVFKWEYKPQGKKELDAFLKTTSSAFRAAVLAAMTTSPGKPGITLEAQS